MARPARMLVGARAMSLGRVARVDGHRMRPGARSRQHARTGERP